MRLRWMLNRAERAKGVQLRTKSRLDPLRKHYYHHRCYAACMAVVKWSEGC